jgi:hypothetical protein
MFSAESPTDVVLFEMDMPAYTFFTEDIKVSFKQQKRFTMSDIGSLEKRVTNLEYYTSLSLLERETKNMAIRNKDTEMDMFKTGFLVDSLLMMIMIVQSTQ